PYGGGPAANRSPNPPRCAPGSCDPQLELMDAARCRAEAVRRAGQIAAVREVRLCSDKVDGAVAMRLEVLRPALQRQDVMAAQALDVVDLEARGARRGEHELGSGKIAAGEDPGRDEVHEPQEGEGPRGLRQGDGVQEHHPIVWQQRVAAGKKGRVALPAEMRERSDGD